MGLISRACEKCTVVEGTGRWLVQNELEGMHSDRRD